MIGVTWGAGGSTATLSMDMALQLHDAGHVVNDDNTSCEKLPGGTMLNWEIQTHTQCNAHQDAPF